MPELPEVECLTRALKPTLEGAKITRVDFLRKDLRWPMPVAKIRRILAGQIVSSVFRRSKYILVQTAEGTTIIHLGMTGNILELPEKAPKLPHTHWVLTLIDPAGRERFLHYIDPRRFGVLDAREGAVWQKHPLIEKLGPEPLETKDLGRHLSSVGGRSVRPVKNVIMDAEVVVGVGNIYASEALFLAGILPGKKAAKLKPEHWDALAKAIQCVLRKAISSGGTTFRDYKSLQGEPGYFAIDLAVYGREKGPCRKCGKPVQQQRLGGRSTFFCASCQN